MSLPIDLTGQVALVTGGGTGLGRAIARALAAAGAQVVITGRTEAALADAAREVPGEIGYKVHDITDLASHAALVEEVEEGSGPVSILVNNAGRHLKAPFVNTEPDDLRAVVETNLIGAAELTRAAVRRMVPRRRGSVVMISSMSGLIGLTGVSAYSLTKAGLLGLTRALAVELGPSGIRVNAICPGFIDTAMFRQAMQGDPARQDRITDRIPLPSLGTPEDIGNAVAFLCSDRGRYFNGVALPVDGGFVTGF